MNDREGERLSKRVAALASCSRREAEQYIAGGWVRVGGRVVEEPQYRVTQELVEIDAAASLLAVTPATLLLHKPPGFDDGESDTAQRRPTLRAARSLLTADTQWADDSTGLRLLKRHGQGLESPVPLEAGASGLLVFTQDWRVLRKLSEDAATLEHEVMVDVQGAVSPQLLERLNRPVTHRGQPLPRVKVSLSSADEVRSRLRFALKGSHPGLLAFLCEDQGLKIEGMRRVRLGRVMLTQLPLGQWRFLLSQERF